MYTYILINFFVIIVPFLFSFMPGEKSYFRDWKYLFPAIILTGLFFIIWDVFFTKIGVWHFNEEYVIGKKFLLLPLEEWLFFITIPYSCVFIYVSVGWLVKKRFSETTTSLICYSLIVILIIVSAFNHHKLYTFVVSFLTACTLGLHISFFKFKILPQFLISYLISLLPFLIVNGILTALPVVEYNNNENLGLRVFTIPIEDFAYSFLLLLMNVSWFEGLKSKTLKKSISYNLREV